MSKKIIELSSSKKTDQNYHKLLNELSYAKNKNINIVEILNND